MPSSDAEKPQPEPSASRGTLVLVVGPSGAGKDSVIAGAAERLSGDPSFIFARRLITRPAAAGGEEHIAVSPAEFAEWRDAGGLMLHWHAHGLDYGLPMTLTGELAAGRTVIANVSRTVIAEARERFAAVAVAVTASPEALAARLAARGRETADDIHDRLRRSASVPADPADLVIENDGALEDAVERFTGVLLGIVGQPISS